MRNRLFRYFAVIAAGAMLLGSMPLKTTASSEAVMTETVADSSAILRENVSLRGEYEKHFLLSDGSYQAVVYDEPIHRLVDGVWEEVDNSLALSVDANGVSQYVTTNGFTDVSFAQSFRDELVTMKQGEYAVSWGVQPVLRNTGVMSTETVQLQPAKAEIVPLNLSGISAEEQKKMVVKSTSRIKYSNALTQGVDLEYTVLPSRVKEDIVLQSPQNISAYLVTIYTEGLSARLLETREIEFFNVNNEIVFTMYAPYMYDSAGELSEEIAVSLNPKGSNCYIMTMIPDANWLSEPDRVYPVVIDPYVSPSSVKSNIIDNYVLEGSGVQDRNKDRLYVGTKSGATARAFLKYRAMPYIPVSSSISGAYQRLEITSGTTTTNAIDVYTVSGDDWLSDKICWDNMPAAQPILARSIPAITSNVDGKLIYYFSCGPAVSAWYTGSVVGKNQNYGIMIRYSDETIDDYNAFYSADCATESSRPSLTINYSLPEIEPTIVWPAPGHYYVTSEWGYRTYDMEMHHGIDISCNEITLVSAISGTVENTFYDSSTGYAMVIQRTESEFQTRYYHLKQDGYLVAEGDMVEAGDPIAISGNTGNSSGPHLHFQLQYTNDKEKSYNPLDIYHPDDTRSAWTNPNPMFYLVEGVYVANEYFNYTYTPSSYNNTSDTAWIKGEDE